LWFLVAICGMVLLVKDAFVLTWAQTALSIVFGILYTILGLIGIMMGLGVVAGGVLRAVFAAMGK
jgi:uncharacterized membrane protein